MDRLAFEKIIAEGFPEAVPEKFRDMVKNVAFLAEDAPSREIRRSERIAANETLLGLYRGIPHARRGDHYGVGPTVPDVIILYRLPIHNEAQRRTEERHMPFDQALREVVKETIWHEVAHYLGIGEAEVRRREDARSNAFTGAETPEKNTLAAARDAALPDHPVIFEDESAHLSQGMEPIEMDKEGPEMIEKMHSPLLPESDNLSTIDSEGGGGSALQDLKNKHNPRRNEPPGNLPLME